MAGHVRRDSPDRILRPRPTRALREALQPNGVGLNGHADLSDGIAR